MRRRPFTLFSIVSLLLCVAVVVLWVRSYWVGDRLTIEHPSPTGVILHGWEFNSLRGRLELLYISAPEAYSILDTSEGLQWDRYEALTYLKLEGLPEHPKKIDFVGIIVGAGPPSRVLQDVWILTIIVHDWHLFVLTLILPMLWLIRFIGRHRRKQHGHCPACGYDLRATPERCPECGTVPTQ